MPVPVSFSGHELKSRDVVVGLQSAARFEPIRCKPF